MEELNSAPVTLPLLPLRGVTAFPGAILSFEVERQMSVAALNAALADNQDIFLVTQREITNAQPHAADLYEIGTVCSVRQVLRIPGGNLAKVMVEGHYRARVLHIDESRPAYTAAVERLEDKPARRASAARSEALIRRCLELFDEYLNITGAPVPERIAMLLAEPDPGHTADLVAQHALQRYTEKQQVLEELDPLRRLEFACRLLSREVDVQTLEKELDEATRAELEQGQRDYYLREQMKLIRQELGKGGDDGPEELDEYRDRIRDLFLPQETEDKLLREVGRLAKQPFGSSESAVIRSYLDTCLELPWHFRTVETTDVARARKCLDEDHFGLEKVKERILEYLAVRQLAPDVRGGVLCLVGPPGVGKTSVALSIARATNRKLARISLGGVHDEAEIRGHRRTYVGAMPGRIISGLIQAKSMNPVMVLDEIDKLGSDYRGDPSAALLEALDGEQNGSFRDNFLEIPIDLGDVFFITTANTTDTIPRALLDRMEVIELGSYTDEEKLQIAKHHLLPKQRKKHGLNGRTLRVSDGALREIIADYTRESGVRVLEREIAAVCRRAAKALVEDEGLKSVNVRAGALEPYLGAPKFRTPRLGARDEVGLVHGLAWTSVGGEVLDVEVSVMDGSGKLELTGNLGDVMKESARAAVSYIRTRCALLGIDPEFYKNKDIHIHFPEGAVPKDGPSAGITICIAVISALTGIPVRRDVAMTGEISLRGRIMPIGGLREKTMAALRAGIHTVIIPAENERDLEEIDQTVRRALNFVTTEHVDNILDVALARGGSEAPAFRVPPESGERPKLAIRQ